MPMYLFTLPVVSTMSNFTMYHLKLQPQTMIFRMLHRQVHALRLELFYKKPSYVWRGCQTVWQCIDRSTAYSPTDLTALDGVPPCPVDALAPLGISYQPLPEFLEEPKTKLQAPTAH